MQKQKIVITGCTRGIGHGIFQHIAALNRFKVIMAVRNTQFGQQRIDELVQQNSSIDKTNLSVLQLDISDFNSIDQFVKQIQEKEGKIDILVNNAGMAYKGDAFDEVVVKETLQTNYYGTVYLTQQMLENMENQGRIITVGSLAGQTKYLLTDELKEQFRNPQLSQQELDKLADQFVETVKDGTFKQKGYPQWGYAVSKLLINTFVKVLANYPIVKTNKLMVYALCPGYVKTDMAPKGELTIEQGIQTPLKLILQEQYDETRNGCFWSKLQPYDFMN